MCWPNLCGTPDTQKRLEILRHECHIALQVLYISREQSNKSTFDIGKGWFLSNKKYIFSILHFNNELFECRWWWQWSTGLFEGSVKCSVCVLSTVPLHTGFVYCQKLWNIAQYSAQNFKYSVKISNILIIDPKEIIINHSR